MFKQIANNINSKKLFLTDGLGAILSAFSLGVVLVKLENFFGIPPSTLYVLAFFPCLFAVYDWHCYQKADENMGVFLKGIAVMNLLYCCLSIAFAFYHYQVITHFGWLYIVLEIMIILTLVYIEFKVAQRLTSKKQ